METQGLHQLPADVVQSPNAEFPTEDALKSAEAQESHSYSSFMEHCAVREGQSGTVLRNVQQQVAIVREITEQRSSSKCQYYAVKSYEAKNEDELSMNVGVIVEVLKKSSDGWWFIRYDGQSGYVPSLYLQPYKNPHSKLQILTKPGRWASTPDLSANVDNLAALSNVEKQNMHSNQGRSPTKTINNSLKLQRQQSRSSTCLPDENLSEGGLSLPNSDESDSRPESLCDDSLGMSESTEDRRLPDSYHILKGSDNVARLFEKNLTAEAMSKNDSGVEKLDLSSRPETSMREKIPATNVVPKIPPRPHRQEILSRCTTFTKNVVLRSQNIPTFQSYKTEPWVTQPKYC
ncbi:neutrophil cytosolic factor 1-like [Rhincodon typus]|uniref:neutrophil cytosolic factor 1-like n=1 Tax=Rhincodon typus TaxID=259920 RepID=UPI00202F164E|nr:neutrophil cytosolic factor 1-like [Rhincodon typus]